ncbi:hypothetical protein DICSQDRAFT_137227 [Dichomitus squalens LYAD-421 SS1]|uniref:Transmembrane protein n=1 Tax=Dichomitus squalens (strain LYAD-421) TaxID=732165 RepID=R7SX91_DICSQ|nr:uncharacterized protein DICSQDRAFT_137227 [Dichomitus squalens LYAD-421 SS1]EJF60686.1 hypothetical protein DICSQDRAFT_137227 [Dichomitus squalens LYAD-421 SS1]
MLLLNYLAFAAFTTLRVYAVWGRDWKPLLLVVPLTLAKPVLQIYEATHYSPVQAGAPFGCLLGWTISDALLTKVTIIAQATTIAAEAILIGLTWMKTFGINRDSLRLGVRTPLATLLLRDGTAYFIILLLLEIVTLVTSNIGSQLTVWMVWPYFSQVFTVIFLSRFMLDLRGLYFADRAPRVHGGPSAPAGAESTFSVKMSDIHFNISRIVGNMGATLSHPDNTSSISSDASGFASTLDVESRAAHVDGIKEVKRSGEGDGWYEDEKPIFVSDPFREGLRPPVMVDIELEAPISPLSPASYQDGSQASSSQVFSHL